MKRAFIPAAILLILTVAYALEVPYLSGRINDHAGMLSATTIAELESMLEAYEDSTGNQFAVLIIPSLEGESLEEYSMRVAETWKLGKKGVDNGALLLIAKEDRKLRIEVGYGLEASLTDAATAFIINNEITPRFKNGDFDGGVRSGVMAMMQAADGTLDITSAGVTDFDGDIWLFLLIWFGIVGIFTFIALIIPGVGWFLYAFLILFYGAGSFVLSEAFGGAVAWGVFLSYLIGFPLLKMLISKSAWGKKMAENMKMKKGSWSSSSGGWSSSGSGWSSGGSSFSGGGGSFGGGGSSGGW